MWEVPGWSSPSPPAPGFGRQQAQASSALQPRQRDPSQPLRPPLQDGEHSGLWCSFPTLPRRHSLVHFKDVRTEVLSNFKNSSALSKLYVGHEGGHLKGPSTFTPAL